MSDPKQNTYKPTAEYIDDLKYFLYEHFLYEVAMLNYTSNQLSSKTTR